MVVYDTNTSAQRVGFPHTGSKEQMYNYPDESNIHLKVNYPNKNRQRGKVQEQLKTEPISTITNTTDEKMIPILPVLPPQTHFGGKKLIPKNKHPRYERKSLDNVLCEQVAKEKIAGQHVLQKSDLQRLEIKQNNFNNIPKLSHRKDVSSIDSGNIASESGSSNYYYIHKELENAERAVHRPPSPELISRSLNLNVKKDLTSNDKWVDDMSVSSSSPVLLQTTNIKVKKGIDPLHIESSNITPLVPPRSRHRPISITGIKKELDEIENQLLEEINELSNPSETVSLNDEEINETGKTQSKNEHKLNIPNHHNKSDYRTTINKKLPNNGKPENNNNNDNEEVMEAIKLKGEKDEFMKNAALFQSQNILPSLDIDTLTSLVNFENVSPVGTEFEEIGMDKEENRILQTLIEALSKLTGDMMLNPKLYNESVNRIKKATKTLDGF
ncbi:hypothetical protein Kpol_479p30 [Vanderwaltozyma polyspora DSM 70294]|uniref:Uncharacterized protein n=1 Tax=Vanderwaltozyma polyspora (strain ATCC 22028 / DSM 70294 / BCRC 21397 / CBS 2163 / NBRC 10782 / NRRL Y-8283 / UCD 57-17) TaxID=436907 RepID=A7TQE3_VANPO|nr:uncharacterized protein Kpol_479p30 [Vanderwaltozyma polyspora DSM 70294]EDO15542.1 hypothetical protein Kpol_479p30 [Vanderwaltozyma polyspora DSM 70294]